MTDEFDMIEIENDWIVRCNKIGMSRNDVVELLNIYKKENEQLKKELHIYDECETISIENSLQLSDEILELKKENEQFKKLNIPIEEIKEIVMDYKGRIIGVYYND